MMHDAISIEENSDQNLHIWTNLIWFFRSGLFWMHPFKWLGFEFNFIAIHPWFVTSYNLLSKSGSSLNDVNKICSRWIPHSLSIAQKRLVSIGRKKCSNACLHFFFGKIDIFCKSIAGPLPSVVQAYTQPYSFGERIKQIICQIRHELSLSWKRKH